MSDETSTLHLGRHHRCSLLRRHLAPRNVARNERSRRMNCAILCPCLLANLFLKPLDRVVAEDVVHLGKEVRGFCQEHGACDQLVACERSVPMKRAMPPEAAG